MKTILAFLALVAFCGCGMSQAELAAAQAESKRWEAQNRLDMWAYKTALEQCDAGQQSSCIYVEDENAKLRQEQAQQDANDSAAALEQQSETAAAQRQRDADRQAWWRNQALQSSIDNAANQASLDNLMQQRAIQESQPPINHFTPLPPQFSYPY